MNVLDNICHIICFQMFKKMEDIHDKLGKELLGNGYPWCIFKDNLLKQGQFINNLLKISLDDHSIDGFVVRKETFRLI